MTDAEEPLDSSGPLGGLPLYESTILTNTFIDMVAMEVRWGAQTREINDQDALDVRDALEAIVEDLSLPHIERVEQRALDVVLGEGAQTAPTVEIGRQLRDEDQTMAVVLLPQSLSIQLATYVRWSVSARPLLEAALESAIKLLGPGIVTRIGLRYVNRLHDDTCRRPADWLGKVDPALLAPYEAWGLQRWVHKTREHIELTIDDEYSAVLRHGVLQESPSDANGYLIDVDVYSPRARPVDAESVVDSFTRMNRTALAIFQQSVNHDYLLSRQEEGESA